MARCSAWTSSGIAGRGRAWATDSSSTHRAGAPPPWRSGRPRHGVVLAWRSVQRPRARGSQSQGQRQGRVRGRAGSEAGQGQSLPRPAASPQLCVCPPSQRGVPGQASDAEVQAREPHDPCRLGAEEYQPLRRRPAKLTRTSRGLLRTARTGHAYQPPACCTYRRLRALLYVRRTRTSLGRAVSGVPCGAPQATWTVASPTRCCGARSVRSALS